MRIQRRNKFNAVKVKDPDSGLTFDSKLEHKRYQELKLMEKAGAIDCLAVHVRWPLKVLPFPCTDTDDAETIGHYESDFSYFTGGKNPRHVIEDCKGVRTALYSWKKKHFELQYPYKITEVTK